MPDDDPRSPSDQPGSGADAAPGAGVAVVILAAGGSTRLGRPKQLLPFRGRTLLRHAVEQALTSTCRPLIIVLGADVDACRREVDGLAGVHVAVNEAWAEGMGSSIRAGIAAVGRHAPAARAAIVMLCDQPLVTGAFLDALAAEHASTGAATVAAAYGGAPGVPALFDRVRFGALAALDGAAGAKPLLRDPAAPAITLPCPDAAIDVDTAADYEALPP